MKNNMHTKDSAIVAACLGSLGRLGNNILQLLFCLCISLESGLHLVVPDTWRDRRYFAALHGSHGSLCTVLPAEECFSLSIVADRVVLSHQGFKKWMAGKEPYRGIQAQLGLPVSQPLSGRQLRKLYPQITPDVLQHRPGSRGEQIADDLSSLAGKALWGYFQYHTAYLQPYKPQILEAMQMAKGPALQQLLLQALTLVLGLPQPLQRSQLRLVVVHVRRGDYTAYAAGDREQPRAAMREEPPFDEGQGQSWGDKSGVFFVSPVEWFVEALAALQPPLGALPPLPLQQREWVEQQQRQQQEQGARQEHQKDVGGGSQKQEEQPTEQQQEQTQHIQGQQQQVDALWLCTDEPELVRKPALGEAPWAILSWESLKLQLHAMTQPKASTLSQRTIISADAGVLFEEGVEAVAVVSNRQAPPTGIVSAAPGVSGLQGSGSKPEAPVGDTAKAVQAAQAAAALLQAWPQDGLEADFWAMREADVLLTSNSTLSFSAALLSHRQPGGGSPNTKASTTQTAGSASSSQVRVVEPVFMRPDVRAGGMVLFDPWDALPILPSLLENVPANHGIHKRPLG